MLGLLFALSFIGCESTTERISKRQAGARPETIELMEGDTIAIVFPGAPDLNSNQQVRRDGKIALRLIGEVSVVGMTPVEVEKLLLELYGDQLVSKEVAVAVTGSSYPVFLQGAVAGPGRIEADRPLTVLEAIMQAGGPTPMANLRKVTVTRVEDGAYVNYGMDIKAVLDGKDTSAFYVKPSDIISVPERFILF